MRAYDNGSTSANRSAQIVAAMQSRIQRMASAAPDPAVSLDGLLATFFAKTSAYRRAVEHVRIRSSSLLADSDGLPARPSRLAYMGYSLKNLLTPDNVVEAEAEMIESASVVGAAIDREIVSNGGMTEDLGRLKKEFETARKNYDAVNRFDQALRAYSSAVGFGGEIVPTEDMEEALSKLRELEASGVRAGDFAVPFPDIDPEDLKIEQGFYKFRCLELQAKLEGLIDRISEFRGGFDEFDVMRRHQEVWELRTSICSAVRLDSAAAACRDVAEQFDVSYFENLHKQWEPKITPDHRVR